jgi:hypothetical protein
MLVVTRTALAVIAGLLVVPAAGAAQPQWAAIEFTPHRAVYDISLERTTPGSGVVDLNGRLVYELTGNACEGYTQNMRFVTQTANQEGEQQTSDLRTSSWEEVPAKRLRFNSSNFQNDQLIEQAKGDAKRKDLSAPVTVDLVKPSKKKLELGADVYFPMQHSMALIDAARSGKRIFKAELYDGSENGQKVYTTNAVIGLRAEPGAVKTPALLKDGDKLNLVPSWPVSVSYFEQTVGKGDVVPSFEMSYRFHENGVTSKLQIDHREFSFSGELKELTYLDPGKCPRTKP